MCVRVCFEALKNSLRSFCFPPHSPPPSLVLRFRSAFFLSSRVAQHTPAPHQHTHWAAHQAITHPIKTTRCLGRLRIQIQISNELFHMPGLAIHHTAKKKKKKIFSTFTWKKIQSLQCLSFHEEPWMKGFAGCYITHLWDLKESSGQVSEQIIHTNVHTPCFLPTETHSSLKLLNSETGLWRHLAEEQSGGIKSSTDSIR